MMRGGDVTDRVRILSAAYTREWRFSDAQPDLGSSLALLFAEWMEESSRLLDELPNSHRIHFYNCLGIEPRPGAAAGGYLTFDLVKPSMPGSVVPRGTGVEGVSENGHKIRYETLEDVAVSPARVDPEPYADGAVWYLRFTGPLTEPLHNLLALTEFEGFIGRRRLCWEYESGDGFLPLAVEDKTLHFSRTGIIRFAAPDHMVKSTHMGQQGFWLRVRDEAGEVLTSRVRFYLNGAAVRSKSGGREGNLPPMTPFKLMRTVGFVSDVKNPDVLYGGTDGEGGEEAMRRFGARIKHQFQAVTPGDIEALALEASLNIERVRCFSGLDSHGRISPGCVTLAVLQKDYEEGRKYFYRLREEILSALRPALSPCLAESGKLAVTEPWFVRMDVNVTVETEDYSRVIGLQKRLETALEAYLNPVTGGRDQKGWEFGCLPSHGQLRHMLQRIEDVFYVRNLGISVQMEAMGQVREINYEDAQGLPWVLPLSGSHRVRVIPGGRI